MHDAWSLQLFEGQCNLHEGQQVQNTFRRVSTAKQFKMVAVTPSIDAGTTEGTQ
jgi:hypothetical protein